MWWWFSCSVVSNPCDPMDSNPPGSSAHEISQSRILEWVAIFFSNKTDKLPIRLIWTCLQIGEKNSKILECCGIEIFRKERFVHMIKCWRSITKDKKRHTDDWKHMKRCSVLLIIGEMQIKTIKRYYLTLFRLAIIKMSTNNKSLKRCEENGTLLYYG